MNQTVIWLDHKEARLFRLDAAKGDGFAIHAPNHHVHRHASSTSEHETPTDALHYHQAIARALAEVDSVLVVGPSTAKLELIRHLHRHEAALEKKVIGVETVDHPSDGQLVAYAKKYFAAAGLQ